MRAAETRRRCGHAAMVALRRAEIARRDVACLDHDLLQHDARVDHPELEHVLTRLRASVCCEIVETDVVGDEPSPTSAGRRIGLHVHHLRRLVVERHRVPQPVLRAGEVERRRQIARSPSPRRCRTGTPDTRGAARCRRASASAAVTGVGVMPDSVSPRSGMREPADRAIRAADGAFHSARLPSTRSRCLRRNRRSNRASATPGC